MAMFQKVNDQMFVKIYAKQLDAGVPVAEGTTSRAASVKPAPPAPAPEPVVTPAPIAASAAVICRDAWGARESLPGGVRHTITRMTLHHTAAVLGDNRNAPGRLRQHQRLHQDERGWVDIAYHVGIDRNGTPEKSDNLAEEDGANTGTSSAEKSESTVEKDDDV